MDKLEELKKACEEAEKRTDTYECNHEMQVTDVIAERLAYRALVAALETRVKELEGALGDLKSFISNYGQDAFPPFKLGDPDTYALKLIHKALRNREGKG